MSKSRIIINADYLNEHAATYQDLLVWLGGVHPDQLTCPIMLGTPGGKIYAIRKPVDKSDAGFSGEAIEVKTEESSP